MENIKIVKLKTTEDVICFFSEDETTITMSSPLTVYIEFNTRKLTQNLVMNFWLPINLVEEKSVSIPKSEVLAILTPKEEFKEYYLNFLNSLEAESTGEFSKEELKLLLEQMDAKHFNKVH